MKTSTSNHLMKTTGQKSVNNKYVPSKKREMTSEDWEHILKIIKLIDKLRYQIS